MKIKKIQKKHNNYLKNKQVNRYLFFKKYHSKKLNLDVEKLLNLYNPKINRSKVYASALYGEIDDKYEISISDDFNSLLKCLEQFDQLDKETQIKMLNSIHLILDKHDLGYEWTNTFIAIIMQGIFIPPVENLYISQEANPKRVTLYLGPNTSSEDIEMALDDIKRNQSELWPNYKKVNFKRDLLENYQRLLVYEIIKNKKIDELNINKLSDYEKQLYNKKLNLPIKERQKIINKSRQGFRLIGNRKKGPVRLKEHISDKEFLISQGVKGDNLSKELQKLRAKRHRIK